MQLEVLLWWLPPVLVTVTVAVWVSWLGREGRGEVDRDVAVQRMGEALEGRPGRRGRRRLARRSPGYVVAARPRDRSSGVAVRHPRPDPAPTAPRAAPTTPPVERRAS